MKKTLSLIVLICLAWNLSALDLLRRGDSTALVTIFNNAGGMNWYNSAGWLTDGVPLEYWYGVTLENNRVVAIDLHSNNLSGTLQLALNLGMLRHLDVHDNPNLNGISSSVTNFINLRVLNLSNTKCGMPDDIGALVNLTYLNFYNNGITRIGGGGGSHLPSSISNLKKLEVLGLGKNHFNGPIPDFSGFNNLWWLDLADNDFSGSIPQSVATLPNLKALLLNDNSLSGSIPPMLWSRTTLELIRLDGNHELTGTISTSIGSLTELKVLALSNNKMSGTIPSSIGNLTKLKELNLGANQFSGTIPTSIGNLTELEQLVLGENQLTGAIPDEIGNLVNIKYYLWLGNNQLSGSIPSTIGNLVNVVDLRLDRNNLSGDVPASINKLKKLKVLHLEYNNFTGLPPLNHHSVFLNDSVTIRVHQNLLTFEDIEPSRNIGVTVFEYAPQKDIIETPAIITAKTPFSFSFSVGGSANTYQWNLNSTSIAGATSNSYNKVGAGKSDEGEYVLAVRNALVPSLTIYRKVNLQVNKLDQTLSIASNANIPRLSSDPPFEIFATATSGLPVTYHSSDPAVASLNDNLIVPHQAGQTIISIKQPGDDYYNEIGTEVSLNVVQDQSPFTLLYQGGTGNATQPFAPTGIEVDGEGNLFIADEFNDCIKVLDASGNLVRKFGKQGGGAGEMNDPQDLAIGIDGKVYVTDLQNKRIVVFNSEGKFLKHFGSAGSADGEFNQPRGIATDNNGTIYVTDRALGRVHVFDHEGNFLFKFGAPGSGNGQLALPRGIDVDQNGNIYVVDAGNARIQVFNNSGAFVRTFGTRGTGDGQFEIPRHVVVDENGFVYVTDAQNRNVQVFDASGVFVAKMSTNFDGEEHGIAIDQNGEVYVGSYNQAPLQGSGSFIKKYSSTAIELMTFGEPIEDWSLLRPSGLTLDKELNAYITDGTNYVKVYNSAGQFLRRFGGPGNGDGEFDSPFIPAIGPNDKLYVPDAGNHRIQVFDLNGNFISHFGTYGDGEGQFGFPTAVATDHEFVYVADLGNNRVQIFDLNGNYISEFGNQGSGDGQFNGAIAVCVDENHIYVADDGNDRIQIFDKGGSYVRQFGSPGTGAGQFTRPADIKVDTTGNIYVADAHNHRVQVFKNDGTYAFTIGSYGAGNGRFNTISSIAVVPSGLSIAVADNLNNLVHVFGCPKLLVRHGTTKMLSRDTHDFGSINMLQESAAIPFTIENIGSAPLDVPAYGISSMDDFEILDWLPSFTLQPGASVTIRVKFKPSEPGERTAQFDVVQGNGLQEAIILNFRGVGVKNNQAINFPALPLKVFGDAEFDAGATINSALPIKYSSSDTTVAKISGVKIKIVGAGQTTIQASQPGDKNHHAAQAISHVLEVAKADQTILISELDDRTFGDAPFTIGATSSSGLPVVITTNSDKVSVNNNSITLVKPGRASFYFAQPGNSNYNAAQSVTLSFCIKPSKPMIEMDGENTETLVLRSNASIGNQWYLDDQLVTGATSQSFQVTQEGKYTVQVAADDCLSEMSSDIEIHVTSIGESASAIRLYPSPALDYLNVEVNHKQLKSIAVKDITGRTVLELRGNNEHEQRVDVRHLQAGSYMMLIETAAKVYTSRFQKIN